VGADVRSGGNTGRHAAAAILDSSQ